MAEIDIKFALISMSGETATSSIIPNTSTIETGNKFHSNEIAKFRATVQLRDDLPELRVKEVEATKAIHEQTPLPPVIDLDTFEQLVKSGTIQVVSAEPVQLFFHNVQSNLNEVRISASNAKRLIPAIALIFADQSGKVFNVLAADAKGIENLKQLTAEHLFEKVALRRLSSFIKLDISKPRDYFEILGKSNLSKFTFGLTAVSECFKYVTTADALMELTKGNEKNAAKLCTSMLAGEASATIGATAVKAALSILGPSKKIGIFRKVAAVAIPYAAAAVGARTSNDAVENFFEGLDTDKMVDKEVHYNALQDSLNSQYSVRLIGRTCYVFENGKFFGTNIEKWMEQHHTSEFEQERQKVAVRYAFIQEHCQPKLLPILLKRSRCCDQLLENRQNTVMDKGSDNL